MNSAVGVIAIGRNEGERLRRCLVSALGRGLQVVYVDSASTDGSADAARAMGAEVVDLDMSLPFSAARARNEGFDHLLRVAPAVKYVQFVDGDCEVVEGWIERARRELDARGMDMGIFVANPGGWHRAGVVDPKQHAAFVEEIQKAIEYHKVV